MQDYFAHIDDYLEGRLSEENKNLFERELLSNTELRAAVENHELIKEVSLGFLEDEVRQTISESGKRRERKWWILILILVIGLIVWFLKGESEPETIEINRNFAQNYIPPTWPIERGAQDNLSKALSLALSGREMEGIRQIKSLDTTEIVRNYWIAEVFAKSGQIDSVEYYLPKTSEEQGVLKRIEFLNKLLNN